MTPEYLHISNFDKYYIESTRDKKWAKIHFKILSDPKVLSLTPEERYVYMGMILMAWEMKNNIPAMSQVLQSRLCVTKTLADTSISKLIEVGLISKSLKYIEANSNITNVVVSSSNRIPSLYSILVNIKGVETNIFKEFWDLYPRRKNKAHAFKAFQKINPDSALFGKIMAGLDASVKDWKSRGVEDKYIPYPATWLNAGAWEDEHSNGFTKSEYEDV